MCRQLGSFSPAPFWISRMIISTEHIWPSWNPCCFSCSMACGSFHDCSRRSCCGRATNSTCIYGVHHGEHGLASSLAGILVSFLNQPFSHWKYGGFGISPSVGARTVHPSLAFWFGSVPLTTMTGCFNLVFLMRSVNWPHVEVSPPFCMSFGVSGCFLPRLLQRAG